MSDARFTFDQFHIKRTWGLSASSTRETLHTHRDGLLLGALAWSLFIDFVNALAFISSRENS